MNPAESLLTPEAVRERSHELYALGLDNRLQAWTVNPERMAATADLVAEVTRANYPDLAVPFHARWRHFAVGGQDRWAALAARLPDDRDERARCAFDAVITSGLLDAGAGMAWRYREGATGETYARSEGLAVASPMPTPMRARPRPMPFLAKPDTAVIADHRPRPMVNRRTRLQLSARRPSGMPNSA